MPAADAIIARDGGQNAPLDYDVPAAAEIVPLEVSATFDGTSAAGNFVPALIILTPDGRELGPYPLQETIAAGASARVSWFPGVAIGPEQELEQTVGVTTETVFYDTPNAGTPLTMTTVLDAGVQYVLVVEGTWSLWNEALGVGSPEAEAQFPGSHAGRVSTQVGLDADTIFARPTDRSDPLGHSSLLTMSLDGGVTYQHIEPVDGPFVTPVAGHLYRYLLTGQGHPLKIKLTDLNPPDNYGKLRFTLQVPSGTGTGSGAGSLVPPADATLNGDVLEVVSGVPGWATPSSGTVSRVQSSGGTIAVTNPTGPTVDLDLPASGVAAGAYGDATHVGQFTVDAKGRLTAAAAIAISGIAGAGFTTLFDQTLGADAASIDTGANGIAQTTQHLLILWMARTDAANVFDSCSVTVNGDTGNNYDRTTLRVTQTTVAGAQVLANANWGLIAAGANAAATEYGVGVLFLSSYTQTTGRKSGYVLSCLIDPTAANNRVEVHGLAWRSTAAINQLTFTHGGGTVLKAGSRLSVYGMG